MGALTIVGIITIVAGVLCMLAGYRAGTRVRELTGTPIAPAASVHSGRNAVQGTVEAFGPAQTTELTNRKCVWYSFRAEEGSQHRDSDGNMETRWQTTEAKTWGAPFLVRDESGAVLVDPTDAKMVLSEKNRVDDENLVSKRTENALLIGDPVYVLGDAAQNSRLASADPSLRVAALELRKAGSEPLIISNKPFKTLTEGFRGWMQLGIYGGGMLAVAGLILTMIAPLL